MTISSFGRRGVNNGTYFEHAQQASYRPTPKVGRRRGCSGKPAGSPAAHAAAAVAVEVGAEVAVVGPRALAVEVAVVGPRALAMEVVAWVVGPRARAEPIGLTEPRAARRLGGAWGGAARGAARVAAAVAARGWVTRGAAPRWSGLPPLGSVLAALASV